MVLETIESPQDLKQLSRKDLQRVVDEARQALLEKTSQHGGHNGPNFGVVEMTVAMPLIHRLINLSLTFLTNHTFIKC